VRRKTEHRLEEHYPGDRAWSNFVTSVTPHELKNELVKQLQGHEDIATVISSLMGESSPRWISQPVAALDGLTPKGCLANPSLVRRLKSMLMRFPS
jgi:hypothetical protein